MEVLKDISQLTKGCGVTFIKNDNFHFYEYLMVHPNRETYYLFIDNWSQDVVRIHIDDLLSGDYYMLVSTTESSSWRREKISSDE